MLSTFFHSSPPPSPPDEAASPPFVLEMRSFDLQSDGTFTPEAVVLLTPALLESRLLLDLTPTEWQTLLTVLCCVTSSGAFVATAEALAQRLHLWPGQMRARLERLMARSWNGEPLLRCQTTETGLRLFAPSPALFEVRRRLVFTEAARPGAALERPAALQQDGARVVGGLREAVMEHSRATYGRPRAEVEAEINEFLSSGRNPRDAWPGPAIPKQDGESGSLGATGAEGAEVLTPKALTPEENAKRELGRRLIAAGLSAEQARFQVDTFPSEVIERQLEYLPFRDARNPTGMLVASIEGDYAPPLAYRYRENQSATATEDVGPAEKGVTASVSNPPEALLGGEAPLGSNESELLLSEVSDTDSSVSITPGGDA